MFSVLSKFYGLAILLLTLIVTVRILGPEGKGAVASVVVMAGLFANFGNFSIGQSILYHVVKQKNRELASSVFWNLILILIVVTLLSWGVALSAYLFKQETLFSTYSADLLLLGALLIPCMIWNSYGNALMISLDEVNLLNKITILTKTVGFVCLCFCIYGFGVQGVIFSNLLGLALLSFATILCVLKKTKNKLQYSKDLTLPLLKSGLQVHPSTVGTYLIFTADIIMISYFVGLTDTGYYQLCVELTGAALVLIQSIAMVLQGHVSSQGPNHAWKQQRQYVTYTLAAMFLAVIFSYIAIPYLLPIVVGDAFAPSIPILQIMLFTLFGHSLSCFMASQWIARGLLKEISAITLIIGLINVGINYLLIPEYGMYGALFASLVASFFSFAIHAFMLVKVDRLVAIEEEEGVNSNDVKV